MLKLVLVNFGCLVVTMVMIWLGLVVAREIFGPWLFMLGGAGILGAVLVSIGARGTTQIYWLGFSVAALSYLGYSWQFDRYGYAPPYQGPELTVQALWHIRDRYVAESLQVEPSSGSSLIIGGWSTTGSSLGREKTFFLIGHMGWAMLLGWLGAILAFYLHSRHSGPTRENNPSNVYRSRFHPMIRIGTQELLLVVSVIGLTFVSLVQSDLRWAMIYVSGTLLTMLLAILSAIATFGMRRIFWIGFSVSAMAYFFGMPRWQEYSQFPDEFSTPTNQLLEWGHRQLHPDYGKQFPYMGGLHGMGGMFSVPEHPTLPSNKMNRFFVGSSRLPETQDRTNPFETPGGNPFGGTGGGKSGVEQIESISDELFDEIGQDTMAAEGVEADQDGGGRQYVAGDIGRFFFIGHCAWTLLFGWLGGHLTCLIYQRSRPPNIPT